MRRKVAAVFMAATLGGCTSFHGGLDTPSAPWAKSGGPPAVPGVKGPHGENVAMAAPYDFAPPGNAYAARQMMNQSIPLSAVQMANPAGMQGMPMAGMPPGGIMPGGILALITPPPNGIFAGNTPPVGTR